MACTEKQLRYAAKYRATHKKELAEKLAAYRASNREYIRATRKAWFDAHPNYRVEYRAEHGAEMKARAKAYHASHREEAAAYHRRVKYGIEADEVEKMLDAQKGLCAICREKKATCVDHNHSTGRVRGMLCIRCNGKLGVLEDGRWVEGAKRYLRRREVMK